ncbi:hypothetical protein EDD21DRAFT_96493 [Dissophora ornata]|nr:hypothetical protein EDD21DRAFT_96493 [Dissophora ornata]
MHHQPYPPTHQHHQQQHHQQQQQQQQHPYPPMHPDMDPHHLQPHSYGPPPPMPQSRAPPSHARSHSRSNSGVYPPPPPPHGHFPAPHHEMMGPGFQGQGPFHPAPAMIAQPESVSVESRHARSHSQSMSIMHPPSGYRTPPPPPPPHVAVNDPHAWSAQPPQHQPSSFGPPSEQHLHQRPPHHPHPYHVAQPQMSHSRPPSRSHSRSHSLSQPQFAPQHSIQSPPPQPRHVSPSVPITAPRYPQESSSSSSLSSYPERVEPVRFPVPAPQQPMMQRAPQPSMSVEEDEENDGEILQDSLPATRRASGQLVSLAEEEQVDSSKCPDCGKLYKHATSLLKHRWEHSIYWKVKKTIIMGVFFAGICFVFCFWAHRYGPPSPSLS